jgi:hypothetical protein
LAVRINAEVEVVQSAAPFAAAQDQFAGADAPSTRTEAALELDALGGVGGVLRYALDAGQSTADL